MSFGGPPPADTPPGRTRVVVAAAVAVAFACALVIVGVVLGVDAATNHGTVGSAARNLKGGRSSPAAGVAMGVLCLAAGAAWLVRGAIRALRRGAYLGIVAPLGVVLVIGSIGEIVDLFGTASGTSDLVGAGILALAAVPVVLLWAPLRASYPRRRG